MEKRTNESNRAEWHRRHAFSTEFTHVYTYVGHVSRRGLYSFSNGRLFLCRTVALFSLFAHYVSRPIYILYIIMVKSLSDRRSICGKGLCLLEITFFGVRTMSSDLSLCTHIIHCNPHTTITVQGVDEGSCEILWRHGGQNFISFYSDHR